MKRIKTLILLAVAAALTACGTTGSLDNQEKIEQAASYIETGTAFGVSSLVASKPDVKPYLAVANEALGVAIQQGDLKPVTVNALIAEALEEKGASEYTPMVKISLQAGLDVYGRFYELNIEKELDTRPALKRFLQAIQAGISSGLGDTELPSSAPEPPTDQDLTLK